MNYTDTVVAYSKMLLTSTNIASMCKKKENKHKTEQLILETSFLGDVRLSERVWYVINDTRDIQSCKMCNNRVKWGVQYKKYNVYCSSKCRHSDPELKERTKQTNIKRYGVSSPTQSSIIQEKIANTNIKRYGFKCSFQNNDVQNKYRLNHQRKYGVDNPLQRDSVKEKIKKTNNDRYSRNSYHQTHIELVKYDNLMNKDWLIDQHYVQRKTITEIATYIGVTPRAILLRFKEWQLPIKRYRTSFGQNQIFEMVKSHTPALSNVKGIVDYELDIYLPEYNLAIEYDGIYWHSEGNGRGKTYHLNKTNMCADKNIRLVHIFENEWLFKQDIVKSRLLNMIGQSMKIGARKCSIVNVTGETKTKFLNENHIQGACVSSINIGLQLENELVALMTFGKSRYNKSMEYELLRYCNKLNTSVTGGASKLFNHFKKIYNPKSVISYSDKRWNTGKLYENLGFKYSHSSVPNFFHFHINKPLELLTRQQFQKHKLKDKLEFFDEEMTAIENMRVNGYDRIWDCGNDVFTIKFAK